MVHNVYFWLKADADLAQFETSAKTLLGIGAVAKGSLRKSAPTAERPVTEKSFHYHLALEFASVEDHNAYQDAPVHHDFVDLCKSSFERVIVYDSEAI